MNRRIFAALAALVLAGCATPVPHALKPHDVPGAFTGPVIADAAIWPKPHWWHAFASPELTALVKDAHSANLDLAQSTSRVMEAEAQAMIERAPLFPQITAEGLGQRAGTALAGSPISPFGSAGGVGYAGDSYGLTFTGSYGLDFWGKARSNLRAAEDALKASRFAQQTVALTVTTNVVDGYFDVLTFRRRIAIAKEDIAAVDKILAVIKLKAATGTSSHLDLAQEQAQMEAVEALLPGLQQQEQSALATLALLLGKPPEQFDIKGESLGEITIPTVRPGLPSALLTRRPDVAQAQADLAAAHANLDAARAAFLPQISLTGSGGFASTSIGVLLHGSNFAWSYGADLLQTIFGGGKLIGGARLAKARQQELVAAYRAAVLNALSDVETSLRLVASTSNQETHLNNEVGAAREAFQIADLQYRQGATSLLAVLQTQQTLFAAEDQLAQIKLAHARAVVGLYQALGGGWSESSGA